MPWETKKAFTFKAKITNAKEIIIIFESFLSLFRGRRNTNNN